MAKTIKIQEDNEFIKEVKIDWDKMKFESPKQWIYFFKSGGWNSEMGHTKKEALRKAKEQWNGMEDLIPDANSFYVPTRSEYTVILNSCY